MPAAAVIPAPKAYINVVAVKKLVVGYLVLGGRPAFGLRAEIADLSFGWCHWHSFVGGHDPDRLL